LNDMLRDPPFYSVGQVSNLPFLSGRLETCPTTVHPKMPLLLTTTSCGRVLEPPLTASIL